MIDYCSVIMTTYRHGERKEISKKSIASLLENTTYPFEAIIVDNTEHNRGLGTARNVGYSMATGSYVCFTDDDIDFQKGWLEECIRMVNLGDKLLATPVWQLIIKRWETEPIAGYRCNFRTGSNCMVMKREAFEDIGQFLHFDRGAKYESGKTGKEYANRIFHKGYKFLITKTQLAFDMCPKLHTYT